MKNIKPIYEGNLCTGCGICEDVCPKNCIKIGVKGAKYQPFLDSSLCIDCGLCLKACPGKGFDLKYKTEELFPDANVDAFAGKYTAAYSGYSNDHDIRYHSASGGCLSQFLIYLLDKGLIDGAVVTTYDEDHITPKPFIARSRTDIIKSRSSKYCPVSLNAVGNEIKKTPGRYVIVGLPCHIQAFRNRAEFDKKFKENVIGYFSIYCSSNRTFNARDFLFDYYNINKNDINYFAFRDDGCLGYLRIDATKWQSPLLATHSSECRGLKVPFTHYYGQLGSFFKPKRCLTCIDHYGDVADICFGDIHIKPYSDDEIGVNSILVRSAKWDNILHDASNDGALTLEPLDVDVLNKSQATMLYPKKRKALAMMNMDSILGRPKPKYDVEFMVKPNIKDYISMSITQIQRFIGAHKSLWPIVKLIFKRRLKSTKTA